MRSETLLRLNRLLPPRLKFAAVLAADIVGMRHLIVRLDPIIACNLRCGMCYFSDEKFMPPGPVRRFSREDVERLGEQFFPLALQVHIGCGTEPTMFKGYSSLVALARRHGVPFIGFTSNGQLLTAPHLRTMIEAGLTEITLSTHGVHKETYERLMVGASWDTYHANLRMLADLKKQLGVRHPRIRINYTVNTSNLPELREFFSRFDDYDISVLQIRPMDNIGNTAYRWEDLSGVVSMYREIVAELAGQCRARGIRLMAGEPELLQTANTYATVYETAVLRVLDPNVTWREDFDFRATTYRQHLKKIGYRRELLNYLLRGARSLARPNRFASSRVLS
jgi:molybdenum cofactor biosynthesis enzyme MoaA